MSKAKHKAAAKALRDADGGYASRKLWYAVGTSVAVVLMGLLAAWIPMFRSSLEVVVGGLCGTLAIYVGANVTGKWAIGKANSYNPVYNSGYNANHFGGENPYYDEYEVTGQPQPRPRPPVEPIPEEQ